MRIGVNCLGTDPSYKGGTTSFTLGLLDGFARVGDGHEFTIFVTPANRTLFEEYEAAPNFDLVEIAAPEHRRLRAIHQRLPLRVRRLLLLHAPDVANPRHSSALTRGIDVLY